MRHLHHLQPVIAHRLERRNTLADAVHQNLSSAAGDGSEARARKLADDLLQRQAEHIAKMDEFARTKTVNVDLRKLAFYMRQQIQIPLQGKFRMMAALHQNLRAAQSDGLFDLAVHFVKRDDVGIVIRLRAIKGAEFAIDVADVSIIDIAINNIGDDLIAATVMGRRARQFAPAMGQHPQFLKGKAVEFDSVRGADAPAFPDCLQ